LVSPTASPLENINTPFNENDDPFNKCDVCCVQYDCDSDGKQIAILMNCGDTKPKGLCFVCPTCADNYTDTFVPYADLHETASLLDSLKPALMICENHMADGASTDCFDLRPWFACGHIQCRRTTIMMEANGLGCIKCGNKMRIELYLSEKSK